MTEVAATRPRITKNQPLLIAQIGEMKVSYINEKKLDLQPPKFGQDYVLFIFDEKYYCQQVTGHTLPFFIACNYTDMDNPPDPHKVAEKLAEAIDRAVFNNRIQPGTENDPDGPIYIVNREDGEIGPKTYYGAYVSSVLDAVEWAHKMEQTPISEWPKEYNTPIE
jgi:hypothetical protein